MLVRAQSAPTGRGVTAAPRAFAHVAQQHSLLSAPTSVAFALSATAAERLFSNLDLKIFRRKKMVPFGG